MAIDFQRLRQQQMFGMPQIPPIQDFSAPPTPTMPVQAPIQPGVSIPPQMQQGIQPNDPLYPPAQPFDMTDRMRQLYQPQEEASGRLNDLMNQIPQRTPPSNLRKIGASAMGLANVGKKNVGAQDRLAVAQIQERFLDAPYHQGMESWKAQMDPALKAADIERAGNVNERGFANQIISQEMAVRRQEEIERKNKAELAVRQQRADVYELKTRMGPGWRFNFSGPTVTMTNPATGEVRPTSIPTGSLSMEDKLNLQGEWGVKQAAERGEQARETADVVHRGDIDEIIQRAIEARETKRTPGASQDNALEQGRERYNLARRLADTVPGANRLLKFGPGGTVELLAPGWSSESKRVHAELRKQLYGMPAKPAAGTGEQNFRVDLPGTSKVGAMPNQPQGQVTAPPGRVVIYDKSGKVVGTVPEAQRQQAIDQGYVVK